MNESILCRDHLLYLECFFLQEQMLRIIALSMRSLGPHAMFYLAAAVSDFYVPWKSMVMIQDNDPLLFGRLKYYCHLNNLFIYLSIL